MSTGKMHRLLDEAPTKRPPVDELSVILRGDEFFGGDKDGLLMYDLCANASPFGHEQVIANIIYNFIKDYCHPTEHRIQTDSVPFRTQPVVNVGNMLVHVGDVAKHRTMFTAHMDTTHDEPGKLHLFYDRGAFVFATDANGKPCEVGADDKLGCYMLCQMIKNGVAGVYLFTFGEECGRLGSRHFREHNPKLLSQMDRCISFDRKGYESVITHQSGKRTCSDEFAEKLAMDLNTCQAFVDGEDIMFPDDGSMTWAPDATGSFTDSKSFSSIIPECTNVSVPYFYQSSIKECFDNFYFTDIYVPILLAMDWSDLPTVRIRPMTQAPVVAISNKEPLISDADMIQEAKRTGQYHPNTNDNKNVAATSMVDLVIAGGDPITLWKKLDELQIVLESARAIGVLKPMTILETRRDMVRIYTVLREIEPDPNMLATLDKQWEEWAKRNNATTAAIRDYSGIKISKRKKLKKRGVAIPDWMNKVDKNASQLTKDAIAAPVFNGKKQRPVGAVVNSRREGSRVHELFVHRYNEYGCEVIQSRVRELPQVRSVIPDSVITEGLTVPDSMQDWNPNKPLPDDLSRHQQRVGVHLWTHKAELKDVTTALFEFMLKCKEQEVQLSVSLDEAITNLARAESTEDVAHAGANALATAEEVRLSNIQLGYENKALKHRLGEMTSRNEMLNSMVSDMEREKVAPIAIPPARPIKNKKKQREGVNVLPTEDELKDFRKTRVAKAVVSAEVQALVS